MNLMNLMCNVALFIFASPIQVGIYVHEPTKLASKALSALL